MEPPRRLSGLRGWGNPKTRASEALHFGDAAAAKDNTGREMAFANANAGDDSAAPRRSRRGDYQYG